MDSSTETPQSSVSNPLSKNDERPEDVSYINIYLIIYVFQSFT